MSEQDDLQRETDALKQILGGELIAKDLPKDLENAVWREIARIKESRRQRATAICEPDAIVDGD